MLSVTVVNMLSVTVVHFLRSRGLSGLVCPSRTIERGGEGYCVNEGGGGEGELEKERALGLPLCHNLGYRG